MKGWQKVILTVAAGLLAAALIPNAALSATPYVQAWVQRYPTGGGKKIAVDPNGSIIVAGNLNTFGPGLVIQYSKSGAAMWTNVLNGPLIFIEDLAVGSNSNVYVTGAAFGGMQPGNCITIAYSTAGIPLWTNVYNGQANLEDRGAGVVVAANGTVIVTGSSRRSATTSFRSYVTMAYSSSGTPLWTNLYSADPLASITDCFPVGLTTDDAGNVYVLGHDDEYTQAPAPGYGIVAYSSAGTPLWVNNCHGCISTPYAIASQSNKVYIVRTTNGAGTRTSAYSNGGALLWNKDVFAFSPQAIATGPNGNIYVTGYFPNSGTGYDCLTLACSSTGTGLWTNRYNGPANTNDYARALAVGSDGTVYVAGYSLGTDNSYDYLTLAYTGTGMPLWTNRYNGPAGGDDQAVALAVDPTGSVYVTGSSQGECTTIKYTPAPAIQFSAIDIIAGPVCRLTITTPTNTSFRLEASTNMWDWFSLTSYSNVPVTSIQYTDPLGPGLCRRYYRTAWAP